MEPEFRFSRGGENRSTGKIRSRSEKNLDRSISFENFIEMFITALILLLIFCLILNLLDKFSIFFIRGSTTKNENLSTTTTTTTDCSASFRSFRRTYLLVFLLATMGDWIQGSHVYALYESYDLTKHEIELLFVAGYGSSMIFGTFIGSVADKFGRRRNCFLYGLFYSMACVTKHFGSFWILFLGRLLSGIATSILYSAFESWAVCENASRDFGDNSLSSLFSYATFGNSMVAIGAGFVAHFSSMYFGYVAPFDIAMVILLFMNVVLVFTWSENYGDSKGSCGESFVEAWKYLKSDSRILCLGLVQSLFEGAMFMFVLEWTPALTKASTYRNDDVSTPMDASTRSVFSKPTDVFHHSAIIPHGFVFATFMVAVMAGSTIFRILNKYCPPATFMRYVLLVASLSLLPPVLFPMNLSAVFAGFIAFETCVGIFWPSMSYMRGIYIPEGARATLMNFFRVPLNLLVITIFSSDLSITCVFRVCVACLAMASVLQMVLSRSVVTTTMSIAPRPLLPIQAKSSGEH